MMNVSIMKCRDCGTVMVIATKELWKLQRCSKCDSCNIINLDDEFGLCEVEYNETTS